MKSSPILVILFLTSFISAGQINCVQHWSHNKSQIITLDSILASVEMKRLDTFYCDSFAQSRKLNHKWYINFYTKHFGNYFSNPRCVCFAMFHFKEKSDTLINEMHITQFTLSDKQIIAFKKRHRATNAKTLIYQTEAFTAYKYVVRNNSIYFISTETFRSIQKKDSFFEYIVGKIKQGG